MNATNQLVMEKIGPVLVVSLPSELGSLADAELGGQFEQAIELARGDDVRHLVIDLASANYFGSQVLEWMVVMWKRIREKNGKIAFCNASQMAREILAVARFDTIWPIFASRDDAMSSFTSDEP